MNAELKYYVSVFLKRLPAFLLVSLTITSTAVAFAVILPTAYVADGLLLVEEAQIPDELASSTVQVDEREQLEIVQRRLMTRSNLIDIAREYEVYEDIGLLNPDQIVNRMRDDTRFRNSGRRDAATLMELEFSARSGEIAAQVVNDYITRILADNADQRRSQAEDTLAFFEQEVQRLETELDIRNQEILRFQNENADALPDTLNYRLNRQNILQERLSQMARDRAVLEEQRSRVVELSQVNSAGAQTPGLPMSPLQQQLASAQSDLDAALTIYSETSPRVRMLRSRLSALEARLEAAPLDATDGVATDDDALRDPATTLVEIQISEIDAQLQFLEEEGLDVQRELQGLEDSIQKTPNNAIALEALERDYTTVQRQHERALQSLSAAVTGERIEMMSKGQRISVIEQALAPTSPDSPNRPLIATAGAMAGVAAGVGLIVLLELLNKSIRRPVDLTNALGIAPLATVPYLSTPWERTRKRALMLLAILIILTGIPAGLYYIHYQVMPLDLVLDRIVSELLP